MAQQKINIEIPSYLRISKVITCFLYFYILLGIISLVFRVFLLLASANRDAGFTELVARISDDYLQPFRGIFPPKPVGETGYLDVSALFAILVYLLILWGVHSLVNYIQNKIDISRANQEKELAKIDREKSRSTSKPRK